MTSTNHPMNSEDSLHAQSSTTAPLSANTNANGNGNGNGNSLAGIYEVITFTSILQFDRAISGYIFSFLDLKSLLNVRSTCQPWRRNTYQAHVWPHVTITPASADHFRRIYWPSLPLITEIRLNRCTNLVDSDISQLRYCVAIQLLDLSYNACLTNFALQLLSHLKLLQVLNLEGCSGITNQGLAAFLRFPMLHSINLSYTNISDEGLGYLKQCTSVEALQLCGCSHITPQGVEQLATLPKLFVIKFGNCGMRSDILKALHTFPALQDLNLESLPLTDDYFEYLSHLRATLRSLNLHECNGLTDIAFHHISQLENLKALFFSYNEITDHGLEAISKLRNLEILEMPECERITDVGIGYIARLIALETLDISGCYRVTDVGTSELCQNLSKLKVLHVAECESLTDASLHEIAKLQNLTSIELNKCHLVTDAGIQSLASITTLTSISLNECTRITDHGLQHLLGLDQLRALCASGTGMTEHTLAQLCTLKSLSEINIYACPWVFIHLPHSFLFLFGLSISKIMRSVLMSESYSHLCYFAYFVFIPFCY